MRTSPFLIVPLLLAGCVAAQPAGAPFTPVRGGEQVACINADQIAGRRAPDNRTLVFEMNNGRIYRNDLQETCLGIERASNFSTLAIDPIENRMCRNDMVRVYDPSDISAGGLQTAPRCRLGTFTHIGNR
jgi:hypothetical protein